MYWRVVGWWRASDVQENVIGIINEERERGVAGPACEAPLERGEAPFCVREGSP